jgi:hypothetical protein
VSELHFSRDDSINSRRLLVTERVLTEVDDIEDGGREISVLKSFDKLIRRQLCLRKVLCNSESENAKNN